MEKAKSPRKREALGKHLAKLNKRGKFYRKHIHDGTVPKTIFGGRRSFTALARGRISSDEWREARNNQVYSIGQANQKGNANIRIVKEGRAVAVRFPENMHAVRTGKSGRVYRVVNDVKEFQLSVPSNFLEYLAPLQGGGAYSVRLTRRGERYFAGVSFEVERPPEPREAPLRVCSVDQNPGGFAAAITSRDGNLVAHRFLGEDRLIYASQGKRDSLVGALVSRIMEFAESWDTQAFATEDLDLRAHKIYGRRANRVVYAFVRRKFKEHLLSRCWKKQYPVSTVNPAYTSKLGAAKYSGRLGLSVHEAAAYVIGRRFYGYGEKLEKPLSIALGRGRMPRVRVPVRYVWASLYGYARPRDPYRAPPGRKGSRGLKPGGLGRADFTGHPACREREQGTPRMRDDGVRKGGEPGGSPGATGNGVKPAPGRPGGKVAATSPCQMTLDDMQKTNPQPDGRPWIREQS
ncbi:MAG: hypothetical protein WED04_12845 [Promethearchaeati archaeon SRVP18_Atabeyarchaeia-1]